MAESYPWQDGLWQQLAGRAQHAHAYLLHGPKGIGKRALAERLAPVGGVGAAGATGVAKRSSVVVSRLGLGAASAYSRSHVLKPRRWQSAANAGRSLGRCASWLRP